MVNDTTLLLGLDGVSVVRVESLADGTRRVHLITADEAARACPSCGVIASRVKGPAVTRPRDIPYGDRKLEFFWHKRRWWCREPKCPRKSFTGSIAQIPAGARVTTRLRQAAGHRVRDAGSTVIQAARDLHLSWPTVMGAFRTSAREVTGAPLPEVTVLGIDETRRGRTKWEQDPDTGKWHLVRDRWHTGFVDAPGTGGLLGQVEGRTVADVLAWLATTPLTWRKSIRHVAIDMSATYRAAVRTGLPHAIVLVDHFHVVQLTNKMLSTVRRRTTAEIRGRRGRATDPEWKAGRRLLRNREDLTDDQFATMWNTLLGEGKTGQTLLTAWIAKENLRNLSALARTGADRHQVGHARWKFLTWCADYDIPEVRTLAATIDRWWTEVPLAQSGSGARHLYLVGGSRSGKSGVLEQILLSALKSRIAVILASPQAGTIAGASLTAYCGDGLDEAMGALRLAYAMMLDREARYRSPAFPFTDPLIQVIIDEAHMLLSVSSPYHAEAKAIVEQLTRRSLKRGIGVVLATQTPLAEDLGNSSIIRSQLLIGGGAVFLRCAKGQGSLVGANAVQGAEGIDLSMIPDSWPGQAQKFANRDMSGLDTTAAALPEDGTFGLGYLLTPGSQAVQFRSLHLDVAPVALAANLSPVAVEDCEAWRNREAIAQTALGDQRGKNLVGSLGDLLDRAQKGPASPSQQRPQTGSTGSASPAGGEGLEPIKPRILELLRDGNTPMTVETIARKLGTPVNHIKPRLSELKKRDEVINENGLWRSAA